MAIKYCLLLLAFMSLLQIVPSSSAPTPAQSANEQIAKLAGELQTSAETLADRLDASVSAIDDALSSSDAQLTSNVENLERMWSKAIDKSTAKFETCAPQFTRLNELSSKVITSTKKCAQSYRDELLEAQLTSRQESNVLKYSANKLAGISVSCVEVNEEMPVCIVNPEPFAAIASLLRKGGEALGSGSAKAEAYGAQILSCWKQSVSDAASLAHAIGEEIAQCTKAQ